MSGFPKDHRGTLRERLLKRSAWDGECLVWKGARGNADGHGRINDGGVSRWTHRVAYELFMGPIPDGMFVCHRCDNPPCIRAEHLFLGTARVNSQDMARKDRSRFGTKAAGTKLNEQMVVAIREALANGVSSKEVARIMGVHYVTVRDVATGKTWRRVS